MSSLLSICDIKDDVPYILDLASKMKAGEIVEKPLEGKTVAMIFEKSSTRTRVSFEVGISQLGGNALFLSSNDLQMGRGEPISDTANVLSRYVDGIMIRAKRHVDVEELVKYSTVPVINGLTDLEHPCQALADMLTIKEHFGTFKNKKICFVGDGNNVCNSLLLVSPLLGVEMSVACPKDFEPNAQIVQTACDFARENNTSITVTSDLNEALNDVDAVYTDVWVSMGDEEEAKQRVKAFTPFQVNQDLMDLANKDAIFMHCLPAIRGKEVESEVIDGPQSAIFDQAENRLHAQKAVLYHLMKD